MRSIIDKRIFPILKDLYILYVEDDEQLGESISHALSFYCKEVIWCNNGKKALSAYNNYPIDMAILDISVPIQNGLKIAQMIRKKHSQVIPLPIIITTAYTEKSYLLEALQLQLEHYLIKPFEFDKLMGIISTYIKKLHHLDDVIILNNKISFDNSTMTLKIDDNTLKLDPKEMRLLNLLYNHKGQLVSYDQIEYDLYPDGMMSKSAIRTIVYALNKKFGEKLINSISNQGYILQCQISDM